MILLLVLSTTISISPQSGDDYSLQELALLIEDSMNIDEKFESTVKIVTTPIVYLDEEFPQPQDWDWYEEIHTVYGKGIFWQEDKSTGQIKIKRDQEAGIEPKLWISTQGWNGSSVYRRIGNEDLYSLTNKVMTGDQNSQLFLFDMVIGRFPTMLEILQIVREGSLLHQSVDKDILTFSVSASWNETIVITVAGSIADDFRLISVTTDFPGSETNALHNTFVIDEWKNYDGIYLPSKAHYDAKSIGLPGYENKWIKTRAVYERTSFKRISQDSATEYPFEVPYEEGVAIFDERLNLSFKVGAKTMVYDGLVYELNEPITSHPGDKLAELLKNAKPIKPPARQTSFAGIRNQGTLKKAIGTGVLATLVTGILLLFLFRYRRATREKST